MRTHRQYEIQIDLNSDSTESDARRVIATLESLLAEIKASGADPFPTAPIGSRAGIYHYDESDYPQDWPEPTTTGRSAF